MSARRDFPATSIGRSHTANITRTDSRESLTAHPLLSTSSAPPTSTPITDLTVAQSSNSKYVPYMPRQRPASSGSPVQPVVSVSPQQTQSQGAATGKLQIMNLKAAAQGIGLDSASIGWAILEKISYEGDTTEEWAEIWNAITKGKASLLLPLEQSTGHEKITPEFVQDHTIVCNTHSRDDTPIITLSGLRGQLVNDVLTLRSTIPHTTKQFQELFVSSSSSRISLLNSLPPLPFYPPESSYPTFSVPSHASLPLPPRASKPPLPPRPNPRLAPSQPPSRLSMPFASFFGQKPPTVAAPTSTPLPSGSSSASSALGVLSPSAPQSSTPTTTTADADSPLEVSAFTIGASISRQDVATEIIAALNGEIAMSLNDQPPWVVDRVQTFASPLLPFVRAPPGGKKKLQDLVGSPGRIKYVVNHAQQGTPEELSQKFQEFYSAMAAELHKEGRSVEREEHKESISSEHEDKLEGEVEDNEKEMEEREFRIRDVLETIEATLCSLLYDRLFLPTGSDDASHDEALSSRIAALNVLDLGLEHLDVDVGSASPEELNAVIRACGETLAQLDLASRAPRDKAIVLVSAHKIIVDGLSKVPPLRLRSGESPKTTPPPPNPPALVPTNEPGNALQVLVTSPSDIKSDDHNPTQIAESALFQRSPKLEHTALSTPLPEPQATPTPVSGDVLFPLLIFSAVKANPPHLVSHLLFTQRFRNQTFGGEEGYCLINLMAVAEFLENVDLDALGLKDSQKVVSTADLTPIPIMRAVTATTPTTPEAPSFFIGTPSGIRGRVEQGVDVIAGSANKVITGVFDTSFGVLRALIPGQSVVSAETMTKTSSGTGDGSGSGTGEGGTAPAKGATNTDPAEPSTMMTSSLSPLVAGAGAWGSGVNLLRRDSGFSLASLAASLPGGQGTRSRASSNVDGMGQRELVEVSSRPASVKSSSGRDEEGEDGGDASEDNDESGEDEDEDEEEEGEEEEEEAHDARSIKSFESMLSSSRKKRRSAAAAASTAARKSLTDRLSNMPGLSRLSHHEGPKAHTVGRSSTLGTSNVSLRLPPPNRRFMECEEGDLRVSEVGELLREYQRLVEAVRSIGGFEE
ncbi:hypothetical protein BKA82DRAFT_998765 [Pisolithus tinctorius]|uniref:VPS9 domain-containing protein n=1 Tax=Pisolithus tinctorius Marx 270 TaxID=870435 RepID=A0A0C3PEH1_PISTI|nr:hypothetical protein BKA82DRAFT_998765 [Pisolithus tinctorius]KIO06626.1 hypothetical protein M404DRAFT_998765 [Pisolithus tinctorius Marx 270]